MNISIPYRAAGTFAGPSYIEREADGHLLDAIRENLRYPYIVAPRQSGKSSLLLHVRRALDSALHRCAFVDLSTFDTTDYDRFWHNFLDEVAVTAALDQTKIHPRRPENSFIAWLDGIPERLIVFVDEIDALLGASFREQFFSKLRSLFNKRAEQPVFERLILVLAGAAHPTQLISDHMRSPFNVGIEISLDALTLAGVREMVSHLEKCGAKVEDGVAERIHSQTSGSVYLAQFILERLWSIGERCKWVSASDVNSSIDDIVSCAASEVHFQNIYRLVSSSPVLLSSFQELYEGGSLDETSAQDLRLTGISDGVAPFRNVIYGRVFGPEGPFDLVRLMQGVRSTIEVADAVASNRLTSRSRSAERLLSISKGATDEELHALLLDGSRRAGDLLVARYYHRIYRFFSSRVSSSVDIDDLVQDTFLYAFFQRNTRGSFFLWLFGVARRMSERAFKRAARMHALFDGGALMLLEDLDAAMDFDLDHGIELRRLARLLSLLPFESQLVIKLRYWDEMSTLEIAGALNISVSAAKIRSMRALRALAGRAEGLRSGRDEGGADADLDIDGWVLSVERRRTSEGSPL